MAEDNTNFYSKLFALTVVLVIGLSWTNALDYLAINYVDDALFEAGMAFAVGRGINAVGSVLESTSVSFQLAVGGSLSIGEVISPLLDMVEDFSTVMKFAIGSLVLQKLLVEIVGTTFFNIVLTLTGGVAVALYLFGTAKYQLIAMKSFITLVMIRFLVVLMALLSGVTSQMFLDERLEQDLQALSKAEETMENIDAEPVIPEELKNKLEHQVEVNESKRQSLTEEEGRLTEELTRQQEIVTQLEDEMTQYSVTDTYNPFTSNEDARLTKERLQKAEASLEELQDQLEVAESGIEDADDELEVLAKQLKGESTGVFGGISDSVAALGGKFSGMADKLSYEELKGSMSSVIDSMLNAMVSFILRAILLPLLFLYLVSKFFKVVWGLDLGKKLKEKTDGVKNSSEQKSVETQS